MSRPILEVKNVSCSLSKGHTIFENASFLVNERDVVVLTGKSGSGKTTLLKCLAHLNKYNGEVLFHGSAPKAYGIPVYRTRVLYVPQRPSLLPGAPRDFLSTISTFHSRSSKSSKPDEGGALSVSPSKPFEVAHAWGLDEDIWDRTWTNLSGGEAQRVLLAIAVGLGAAEVLLLDEPTSALDAETSELVEKYITSEVREGNGNLKAVVWITHSHEQGQRVGTRFLEVANGGCEEVNEARAPDV